MSPSEAPRHGLDFRGTGVQTPARRTTSFWDADLGFGIVEVDGTGDGDTSPDWQILGPKSLLLRAERAGSGSGRIYTMTATCTDTKDNSSSAATPVTVSHDRR